MARLLVLGGSWFLGTRIVSDALTAGWEVTTFRRGYYGNDVPGAHTIRGDRTAPTTWHGWPLLGLGMRWWTPMGTCRPTSARWHGP